MVSEGGIPIYEYRTKHGVVSLVPEREGGYSVIFQGENLGTYHSAAAAAGDVSRAHVIPPASGIDLGELGIPSDIEDWHIKPQGFRPA